MAASAQITLRKKPNNRGLFPIAIRITKNRISTYKHIGPYIDIEDWDDENKLVKEFHPNSKNLNKLICNKLKEANKGLTSLQIKDKDATAFFIKKEIYKPSSKLSFFELAQEHLDDLEVSEKYGRLSTDSAYVGYILKYNKSKQLRFKEIDERFLKKLKVYLIKEHALCETSIMNVFVMIRLLYNRAISGRIVKKKFYPFGSDRIKIKFPETEKIGLNSKEILRIEALKNLSYGEIHARNVWLYSFNFAGMRVSDVLKTKWKHIKDDRLYYRMGKNSKLLSLKIPEKIQDILDFYINDKRNNNDFIFPELKKANVRDARDVHRKIKTANKKFNYYLKGIAEKAKIEKS